MISYISEEPRNSKAPKIRGCCKIFLLITNAVRQFFAHFQIYVQFLHVFRINSSIDTDTKCGLATSKYCFCFVGRFDSLWNKRSAQILVSGANGVHGAHVPVVRLMR